jgi:hypothetical protein
LCQRKISTPTSLEPVQVAGSKSKSISAMKEERRELLHQYQRICHECSRLRQFVRYIDYMVRPSNGC